MPGEIEQSSGDILGSLEALVEALRLLDSLNQILRHDSTSLIMLRVVGEHRGLQGPVLIELRGELHEVGGCVEQCRVLYVLEDAVQRVAELVEHGGDVLEAQQGGHAGSRLGE